MDIATVLKENKEFSDLPDFKIQNLMQEYYNKKNRKSIISDRDHAG